MNTTLERRAKNLVLNNGILIAIVGLIILTGIIEPNFFAWSNMLNILRQISVNGIVACGMTVCIMSSCYDLSVGIYCIGYWCGYHFVH